MIPDLTVIFAEWAQGEQTYLQVLLRAPDLALAAAAGALAGLLRLRLVVLAILLWAAAAVWLATDGQLPSALLGDDRLSRSAP